MENRIKEKQLMLFADRTSSAKMRANQLRLYFSSIAYLAINADLASYWVGRYCNGKGTVQYYQAEIV